MRHLLPWIFAWTSLFIHAQEGPRPPLIPKPVRVEWKEGAARLDVPWTILLGELDLKDQGRQLAAALAGYLPEAPLVLPERKVQGPVIRLAIERGGELPPEGYLLRVGPRLVEVIGADQAGVFRGTRTLLQLLPAPGQEPVLPALHILDHPRFPWRGMHLDVCRHFFGADVVKKYIDVLARYKMNTFHWHLTDDQGWRIPIAKYPRLTEVGAWRSGSQIGPYAAQTFDDERYGGFYTREEIREVVSFAAQRHVTIVPEIEMPGHAMAALASYPHLGCTGVPYEVQRGWGVFDDVFCAGNDSVFTFLEDVLTEVMELFPGEYIHIGGDECPKTRWRSCPKCQARMKAEGLKDEHELQSYFIRRIEKFVNSKGRKIIGWDEILEGGLAPNAAVMSWRGTEGGIAAARAGHHAVMSPGSHCYFDHYQGDPANERVAIGGYTTVQKVYGYEPIPAELKPQEHKYILGAQGNVWTEYILSPEHVEYMALPRMLALAEVVWTPKDERDEADFLRRLEAEFPRLDALDVHASRAVYEVRIIPSQGSAPGRIRIEMVSPLQRPITYSIIHVPGTSTYTGPFEIDRERVIGAGLTEHEGGEHQHRTIRSFHFNMATARPIALSSPPHERYSGYGAFTLVDGVRGGPARGGNEWLAWKNDVTITVDLGEEKDITRIGIGALGDAHSWIHLPREVSFSTSTDGDRYTEVGTVRPEAGATGKVDLRAAVKATARFVRLEVRSAGGIPESLPGAGHPAWLFLDEVTVE